MTEQSEADKYIKCSKCRCKYINDDEHIKNDFGYNRLEEQFKTCVKCRPKSRQQNKEYRQTHKEEIAEKKQDYNKRYYQNNKEYNKECGKQYREKQLNAELDENHKCCTRCYKIKPITEYGECVDHIDVNGVKHWKSCKSCNNCRKRGKHSKHIIEQILDSSSDDPNYGNWFIDSSDEEEVKKGGMKQLFKAINKIHLEQ